MIDCHSIFWFHMQAICKHLCKLLGLVCRHTPGPIIGYSLGPRLYAVAYYNTATDVNLF